MSGNDSELQLLQTIYSSQEGEDALTQRALAGKAGLSLGMTNVLLKRFAERGWVKLTHVSGSSLKYILTPTGMETVFVRSLAYFTRAARFASLYRGKIDEFVRKAAGSGCSGLVLVGPEELDFLFEYACSRNGLSFSKNPARGRRESLEAEGRTMFVFAAGAPAELSEACEDSGESAPGGGRVDLADILLGRV